MIPVLGVPTLNRADLLARLVASIDYPVGHLVIVDNGRQDLSELDVPDWVDQMTVTTTAGNLGVAGSWNLIIKSTPLAPWWLIVNDDAWFPADHLWRIKAAAQLDAVTLSRCPPPWACFTIGEDVVSRVGLFDERFYPAYCEDTDYARRCEAANVEVIDNGVKVWHDNSSTIAASEAIRAQNVATYNANSVWHHHKIATEDNTADWSLDRRRQLHWEG